MNRLFLKLAGKNSLFTTSSCKKGFFANHLTYFDDPHKFPSIKPNVDNQLNENERQQLITLLKYKNIKNVAN